MTNLLFRPYLPPKESMLTELFTPKIIKEFVLTEGGLFSSDLGKGRYEFLVADILKMAEAFRKPKYQPLSKCLLLRVRLLT